MTTQTLSVDTSATQPTREDKSKQSKMIPSPQHSLLSPFSDDMNEILAPSMDDDEYATLIDHPSTFLNHYASSFSINNTFSVDESILRRVEQEISAARGESGKDSLKHIILNSTISNDDMAQILQTLSSTDKEESEDRNPQAALDRNDLCLSDNAQRMEVESQSSFDRVMDMIDSEFKDSVSAVGEISLEKIELVLHQEEEDAQEVNQAKPCPLSKENEDLPSTRDIMDGFVELLSQGLMGVKIGEQQEDSPKKVKELEQSDVRKQSDDDVQDLAVADAGPLSKARHEMEAVEHVSRNEVPSEITGNSYHESVASDHSDEEQAVAKWAQLLAESSPEGDDVVSSTIAGEDDEASTHFSAVEPDDVSTTGCGDESATFTATKDIESDRATKSIIQLESTATSPRNVKALTNATEQEADWAATTKTQSVGVTIMTNDVVVPATPSDNVQEADEVTPAPEAPPVEIEKDDNEALTVATQTALSVEKSPGGGNGTAKTTIETDESNPAQPATPESTQEDSKPTPLEKIPEEKCVNAVSTKPPLAPSPRLYSGMGSPSLMSRSLREARMFFTQREAKHMEKDTNEQLLESDDEQSLLISSRKLRFRKSFPVLKPARGPRVNEKIIQSHSHGIPSRPTMWVKPQAELKQLIVAAMGTSLQRRSNACGALKVLSLNKKNQLSLARTDTFLTALVFAISQEISDTDHDIATTARVRALTCLRNVCRPKENRVHAFTQPGLMECLINVINEDKGESRVLACSTLALLAKSAECREGLGIMNGLVDCLSRVVGQIASTLEHDEEREAVDNVDDSSSESDADTSSDSDSESSAESSAESSTGSSESSEASDGDESSLESNDNDDSDTKTVVVDTDIEKLHQDARLNACAVLVHLSRSCAISVRLLVTYRHA
ncbi:hypothetical protein FisN_7Lh020 [Fistulifera solaris]|uniref:Uncharacterized protein n=1 Tax=Fistulifera solaris TaxID=1519565 RepID=A0A1Z5JCC9_FISSO|nr:hypothetical protein FisN_7Lh020 [Fistulifera solaris]|eukprot:GAX11660.1 hypothetical protein FisN_7Lh020 [Fistulifera solaris]